jgi:hypothetical protein
MKKSKEKLKIETEQARKSQPQKLKTPPENNYP